jgi:hypothetical protein
MQLAVGKLSSDINLKFIIRFEGPRLNLKEISVLSFNTTHERVVMFYKVLQTVIIISAIEDLDAIIIKITGDFAMDRQNNII